MKAKYNSLRTSLFFSALLLSVGAASADVGRSQLRMGQEGGDSPSPERTRVGVPMPLSGTAPWTPRAMSL